MKFSTKEKYIVVNYHYVRDPSDEFKGINSCSLKEFERQIKFLSANYKIVSIPEVLNSVKKRINGKFCAITFDDCLKDIESSVLPVLNKYNIRITVFPIASVLDGKMPYVHKIHILISKMGVEKLVDLFNDFLEKNKGTFIKYRISKKRRLYKKIRLDDDILTANFKETMGIIPSKIRDGFINEVSKNIGIDDRLLLRDFFMSPKEIKKTIKRYAIIGSHSYGHDNLTSLSMEDIKKDFNASSRTFNSKLKLKDKVNVFSFPYGKCDERILKILPKYGFEYAVTIKEESLNRSTNRFLIPRYDTNNIRDYLNSRK